jgi:ADP-ribose pyrophosphatase YjhB (NUDIX family)
MMSTGVAVTKRAVALVMHDSEGRFLAVQRAEDDESLPGMWGLPAASLRADESDHDAVARAGRDKLGVRIEVLNRVGTDRIQRDAYVLELSDYRVQIVSGRPTVPQPDPSISQYVGCCYSDDLGLLVDAARAGSLCSRVYLDSCHYDWR